MARGFDDSFVFVEVGFDVFTVAIKALVHIVHVVFRNCRGVVGALPKYVVGAS